MKNSLSLFVLSLLLVLSSCGMGRHATQHPAVKPSGYKAQKTQQDKLASGFGGVNLKKPNNFKSHHFKKGFVVRPK